MESEPMIHGTQLQGRGHSNTFPAAHLGDSSICQSQSQTGVLRGLMPDTPPGPSFLSLPPFLSELCHSLQIHHPLDPWTQTGVTILPRRGPQQALGSAVFSPLLTAGWVTASYHSSMEKSSSDATRTAASSSDLSTQPSEPIPCVPLKRTDAGPHLEVLVPSTHVHGSRAEHGFGLEFVCQENWTTNYSHPVSPLHLVRYKL